MTRVCLVTTSQPSANPRLVKEADALAAAGYDVHVVGAHWVDWATESDARLLARRRWTMSFVDWRRTVNPALWWKSRLRQHAALAACRVVGPVRHLDALALARLTPELRREARRQPADLFIAHNLGALPVALDASARYGAAVGFDAEDFHSGQLSDPGQAFLRRVTESVERRCLPRCDYVTAAAPLIAEAYERLCDIPRPSVVLNVFPRALRPASPASRDASRVRLYWFSQTIGPNRGLEDAVRALAHLPGFVELHLRGRWHDGYEARLRRLASDAGVAGTRIVSHPPAHPDELVALAAPMHVGLALEPPVSENNDILWSNKVFTFILAGVPVALSRTTGQSALARELGGAAVTYEPGDARGLAEALRPWIEQPALHAQAAAVAWQLGDERFNWETEQHAFLDIVARVLASRARKAS
ncbi:MAG TPA: glycosyltransferase [Vicinamibacterales bacterium]